MLGKKLTQILLVQPKPLTNGKRIIIIVWKDMYSMDRSLPCSTYSCFMIHKVSSWIKSQLVLNGTFYAKFMVGGRFLEEDQFEKTVLLEYGLLFDP